MKTPKFKPGDIVVTQHGDNEYCLSTVLFVSISEEDGIEYSLSNNYFLPENRLNPFETVGVTEAVSKKKDNSKIELPKTYAEAFNQTEEKYFRDFRGRILKGGFRMRLEIPVSITESTCKDFIAFEQLIFLRDIYRQGWKPNKSTYFWGYMIGYFADDKKAKFVKTFGRGVLSFQTEEIRDLFFENFLDLITKCKEFI